MITKEEFYERYVNHWMRSDINSMRNHGNNFPLALCTLSYIEFLGSILTGNGKLYRDNVKKYIDECFNKKDYDINILWDVFRNGLAHDYFPRGGVSKEGPGPMLKIDNKMVLNIMDFSKEFLDSLDQFKITLDKEENIKNFGARIKEMTDRTAELETDHLHKLTEFIFPVQARDSTGSIFTEIAPSSGPTKLVSQTIAGYPMAISALDNGVVIKEQEHDRNSE
ncbi:MAG: hypothetical protein A3B91_03760 [Candidatus Yanofskybacteria bacterium RIFCSPHIGHO2_02_FULL_41_29]|uniref:Uncharacterized protein n=1 Tax=Candidatus Yanofskybacteria bacterium RIFCSPHIGHO2_01_FULL_41_53 TaxID=1802663 RepID=A0A1F8EMX0_9BACT|nr:MAG: hypothetical protein A2650_00585 [Candidatus Yanofskybacteria bacterium RIFCSPHIGHO2_01_FULL_41_53]OGN10874.1 MAG: hypothetical protein A3B91_03760 [Candidatus Yanofskybacteria bacterium RIFCSPHIGHO2_02_FULL_41_29]OGN17856.1 MAG: hypothetical protein A3F48_03375 [Candidatus Yanofskybacteria bacterium RIFCSPHIGHO2_12_FULL_41_9]OGN24463.1 MAG: hypothetical protein A2916_02420 [Candidatus Yanofskybacteria bacterium RIFCSPLOWO2_01_FULL_41_67]OGN29543.1 MAG: hypothetical protein A3H54_01400 